MPLPQLMELTHNHNTEHTQLCKPMEPQLISRQLDTQPCNMVSKLMALMPSQLMDTNSQFMPSQPMLSQLMDTTSQFMPSQPMLSQLMDTNSQFMPSQPMLS